MEDLWEEARDGVSVGRWGREDERKIGREEGDGEDGGWGREGGS